MICCCCFVVDDAVVDKDLLCDGNCHYCLKYGKYAHPRDQTIFILCCVRQLYIYVASHPDSKLFTDSVSHSAK